jgi:hypothetical protein
MRGLNKRLVSATAKAGCGIKFKRQTAYLISVNVAQAEEF